MLFGIEWDTTNHWLFAVSILPILLRGLVVTIQATVLGFFVAALLGLVLAPPNGPRSRFTSWPAKRLTVFIRETPLLIHLCFLYLVLRASGIVLPSFMT